MEERRDKQIIQQVFQSSLSGIQDDPWMARRVLDKAHETGGFVVKKKISLAMVLLIVCLLLSFTVALATIISNTAQRFGEFYGEEWTDAALDGDIDTSNPSIQIGDVIYAMDDVIVTGIELEGGLTNDDDLCTYILATGTMKPADGANVILIPEDYLLSDPWNFDPYYNGHANIPEGAVSVLEKANETGASILCTRATANGLMDSEGNLYEGDSGYAGIIQEDGSVMFMLEINLFEPIPRQESYTLSVYIANHQVNNEGEHLMDTRIRKDWVFTIHPQQAEVQPASQPKADHRNVQFGNWENTVRPLVDEEAIVTVEDPITGAGWQMRLAVAGKGRYADAKPIHQADADAMVSAVGSTMSPQPVYVTFPNGQTYLGTLGSRGYDPDEEVVYDEDGTATLTLEEGEVIELKQVAYIHFPRDDDSIEPNGYGAAHQKALMQAWKEIQP